ncbi:anti-sigma factor family protein [Haloferula sargassicola]|uniref:FecR protein domain-containing protein n=1 Tax=Haloferula sargassicola TaxID=490096 RepID=A0ABP9UNB6_9BACT
MSRRSDEEIIQQVLDGTLDERSFGEFEARLRSEPALRTLYLSYSRSHHLLAEKFATSEPAVVPLRRGPRRRLPVVALAACAAGLAVAAVFFRGGDPAAAVVLGPESHGRIIGSSAAGELAIGGRLELDHGSAAIRLPSGQRAYFEGPGCLERLEASAFKLDEGRIWFGPGHGVPVSCETKDLKVVAERGEFGLIADAGEPQELQVLRGEVEYSVRGGKAERAGVGRCLAWQADALATGDRALAFSSDFPHAVTVFSDDFDDPDYTALDRKEPDTGAGPWSVVAGGPTILGGVLDTSGNTRHIAFAPLVDLPLDELSHVLLLTLETEVPGTDGHSQGWAGVSLYTGDQERIFLGDPCGPEDGWALHPVGYEARNACPLLRGKSTVTLRYDYRSGLVQLFEGTDTTGPALASEWISPGLSFDRIRIANGSQADAAADAGKDRSAAGDGPGVNSRSNIALRRVTVSVLCARDERRVPQP